MSNTKLKNLNSAGVVEQRHAGLIAGSFRFYEEFATGVQLMRKRLIDVKPLTTHTVPLENALSAFEILRTEIRR